MRLPPLAAYVHLPWCVRKCPYCDFNSHPQRPDNDYAAYTAALIADLQWSTESFECRPLRSVFFGGGTPSLCPPQHIAEILAALEHRLGFAHDIEVTLEANPGTVDADHFRGYRAAGVNRLSIGVQSFHGPSLRRLGRIHDGEQARKAIRIARAAGFDNINIDLMHDLPEQSVEQALRDIDIALEYEPEHLSWYELTLEPNTAFAQRPPALPDEGIREAIERRGRARLRAAGYGNYEVSAWARAGRRAAHNLNYWRYGDFLGLGAGAHSKLSAKSGLIQRIARQRAPARYLQHAGGAKVETSRQPLSTTDRIEEFVLNAFRLREGFSLGQFEARTDLNRSALGPGIARAGQAGLLLQRAQQLRASALGRRYLNNLLACFAPSASEY